MRIRYDLTMPYNDVRTLDSAASRVLVRIKTIFPFKIFADIIEVTDSAVTVIYGLGFWSKQVVHMPIKEIQNVKLTTSLLFSSLTFEIKGYEKNPQVITYLPNNSAIDAEAIISGLILCGLDDINTLQYPKETLLHHIRSMGNPETVKI